MDMNGLVKALQIKTEVLDQNKISDDRWKHSQF